VLRDAKMAAFVVTMHFNVFIVVNAFRNAKIAKAIVKAIAVDVVNLKPHWVRAAAKHPDNTMNQVALSFNACRKIAAVVDSSRSAPFCATASRNTPNKIALINVPREEFT